MITLQTADSNNDLVLTNGQLTLISGDDQIRQSVLEALYTFFGEWFLDNRIGVPWFQSILVSHPNLDIIQATLISAILNVPGIVTLNGFQFQFVSGTRALSVSFTAQTSNGQVIVISETVGI